jgi:hypothetical protein
MVAIEMKGGAEKAEYTTLSTIQTSSCIPPSKLLFNRVSETLFLSTNNLDYRHITILIVASFLLDFNKIANVTDITEAVFHIKVDFVYSTAYLNELCINWMKNINRSDELFKILNKEPI